MGGPVFSESVEGVDVRKGYGVRGKSTGNSAGSFGVLGEGGDSGRGVIGRSDNDVGVQGSSKTRTGVEAFSDSGDAVFAESKDGNGVIGISSRKDGVSGSSTSSVGVVGSGNIGVGGRAGNAQFDPGIKNAGVVGASDTGDGVQGYSSVSGKSGVYAKNTGGGFAAYLDGNVRITGTLEKPSGSFRIDHPLDPTNKYLSHSFVESPDMKNVYDGVVVLDDKGEADIELPDWFGALNKDFRYQLTAIGSPGPNLYIAGEISDDDATSNYNNNKSRFKIAGGTSGMKVSWQVTGIRMDPWANAYRIRVEEDKPAKERGYYTYPELYGQPEEKGIISRLLAPEIEKRAAAHK
jgi:hypothetical protein